MFLDDGNNFDLRIGRPSPEMSQAASNRSSVMPLFASIKHPSRVTNRSAPAAASTSPIGSAPCWLSRSHG